MIACLKIDTLPVLEDVQKSIDLDSIMSEVHFFNDREDAIKEGYLPVHFTVSIRTLYTNLVVKHGNKYYVSCTLEHKVPHKGNDLLAYVSSLVCTKMIDCTKVENQRLMFNSQLSHIGLYNPDPGIIDPVIYSHVIFPDESEIHLKSALLSGNELVPIPKCSREGNISALLRELIIL